MPHTHHLQLRIAWFPAFPLPTTFARQHCHWKYLPTAEISCRMRLRHILSTGALDTVLQPPWRHLSTSPATAMVWSKNDSQLPCTTQTTNYAYFLLVLAPALPSLTAPGSPPGSARDFVEISGFGANHFTRQSRWIMRRPVCLFRSAVWCSA